MEMADNPKLELASCFAGGGGLGLGLELEVEENMTTTPQKISILDHMNGFQSTKEKSADSFMIDMETFSPRSSNMTPNSRITLQRSLSRKGFQRGGEKKNCNPTPSGTDRDRELREGVTTSSPKGPENSAVVSGSGSGTADHSSTPKAHHQITVTTGNINGSTEGRCTSRRNSMMKRSSATSWGLDPKRVLFFFATLSSIGTLLLIYFTLSLGKPSIGQETWNLEPF